MKKEGESAPMTDAVNKIELNAGESLNVEAVLAREDIPSILVTVQDSGDSQPIVGASVRLQFTGSPAYDETLTTNQFGQVFFPEVSGEIIEDNYNYTINADGYDEDTGTFTIIDFTEETVQLDPS